MPRKRKEDKVTVYYSFPDGTRKREDELTPEGKEMISKNVAERYAKILANDPNFWRGLM